MPRRQKLMNAATTLLVGLCCAFPAIGAAQNKSYPTKTITLIVPFAPGNASDSIMRLVTASMSTELGQQIVIENRPGSGAVGPMKQLSNAAPDGYTLVYYGVGGTISQSLFKPPPYDMNSYTPIAITTSNDVLILVGKESKLKNMEDVMREAKLKGDRFTVGIGLFGTTQHMASELFKSQANLDYTIVPFKSATNLNTALRNGDVDMAFEFLPPMQSLVNTGNLKALAIGSAERSSHLPKVPTLQELGFKNFNVSSWGVMLAPPNTPDAIIQTLNKAVQHALKDPSVIEKISAMGTRILGGTSAEAKSLIASDITKWQDVIRKAKINIQ